MRTAGRRATSIIERFLWFLFPPRCIFCRKILERGDVCDACIKSLPTPQNTRVDAPPMVNEAVAPFYYEGRVRDAIHVYKFRRASAYAATFARFMGDCVENALCGRFDVITWVPISRRRLRARGFDQSELLARELGKRFAVPVKPLLLKTRHNPPQSRQSDAAARRANASGAYALQRDAEVFGARVLLVDDVLTTGATMSECARMLKTGGANAVYSVVIAKTRICKKRIEKCAKWYIIRNV